ncbi:MAG: zinc ribbon domain-containing protein [Acidobacteriota bacterium]|nr:zinc ribbon domain-containing protein [Acidobacteriota bacterium]MDH3528423.1 zinc ribbon domain-containing protein [Acidobacteriota bacterium]
MAETLVKNPTCSKCGEDARPQALFCHACGGEIIDLPQDEKGSVSAAWFREEIVEVPDTKAENSVAAGEMQRSDEGDSPAVEDLSAEVELRSDANGSVEKEDPDAGKEDNEEGQAEEKRVEEEGAAEAESPGSVRIRRKYVADRSSDKQVKLKTASDLRRRPKSVHAKRVEVVWEENSGSPNVLFLAVGLLIATVAGVLLLLAYYLK